MTVTLANLSGDDLRDALMVACERLRATTAEIDRLHAVIRKAVDDLANPPHRGWRLVSERVAAGLRSAVESRALPEGKT